MFHEDCREEHGGEFLDAVESAFNSTRIRLYGVTRPDPNFSLLLSLAKYAHRSRRPTETMAQGYASGGYTLKEIAAYYEMYYCTANQAVTGIENHRVPRCGITRPDPIFTTFNSFLMSMVRC